MFCSYCGNKVTDDALFCSNCGKKIVSAEPQAENIQNQSAPVLDAQENICNTDSQKLFKAIAYFKDKSAQYAAYDRVCNLINYYAKGAKSVLLVLGCIVMTFGILGMLGTFEETDGFIVFIILFLLPGLAMLIGGIMMKVNNRKKLAYYKGEYARLSHELYSYYLGYPDCPVSAEYTNPEILNYIMSILQSAKANTISASINILTCGINQAKIADYLNKIRQNTADVNIMTNVTTFFAPAEFFR